MDALTIAQLIIAIGAPALKLIPKLAAVWTKPELPAEEVIRICEETDKSYQELKAEVRAQLGKT